jgi:hypothetical protein
VGGLGIWVHCELSGENLMRLMLRCMLACLRDIPQLFRKRTAMQAQYKQCLQPTFFVSDALALKELSANFSRKYELYARPVACLQWTRALILMVLFGGRDLYRISGKTNWLAACHAENLHLPLRHRRFPECVFLGQIGPLGTSNALEENSVLLVSKRGIPHDLLEGFSLNFAVIGNRKKYLGMMRMGKNNVVTR